MRFSVFFAVLLVVLGALAFYVHRRAAEVLTLSPRGRRALAILLAIGLAAMPLGRLGRSLLPATAARSLILVGSLLGLSVLISSVLLALVDLTRLAARLLARLRAARVPAAAAAAAAEAPPAPSPVPRRTFLAQGAAGSALLIGSSSSVYGALVGRHDYELAEVPIPIPGLPKALDGFSIVQLSDIHLGLFVGEPQIRAAEELVRRARGDIVVLTGDLIDFDPAYADLLGVLARRLGPLAREGVVAIPGNHDYFTGIDVTVDALQRGGAEVLRNRGRVIGDAGGGFALLGVNDVWAARMRAPGGGPDVRRAIASVPRDLPRVLLCHNPVYFPEAAGEVALQLSGHTHGGQVNLVVRPADWVLPHGYVAGLYERGGSRLYINRGFGTAGPPARVGAPPEVTRVVLVSA